MHTDKMKKVRKGTLIFARSVKVICRVLINQYLCERRNQNKHSCTTVKLLSLFCNYHDLKMFKRAVIDQDLESHFQGMFAI